MDNSILKERKVKEGIEFASSKRKKKVNNEKRNLSYNEIIFVNLCIKIKKIKYLEKMTFSLVNFDWCARNIPQRIDKGTGSLRIRWC